MVTLEFPFPKKKKTKTFDWDLNFTCILYCDLFAEEGGKYPT